MPPELSSWVEARIAEGRYADAADYMRDLVRRDIAEASQERLWLKAMIEQGLASGIVGRDADEVIEEIIAEDPDLRD